MIEKLLLDIDNTLYHPTAGLWEEILLRINSYVSKVLGVNLQEADRLRRLKVPVYGTSLRWLEAEQGFHDRYDFMDRVHPKDLTPYIPASSELLPFLESLLLPIAFFTNGPRDHASRVLSHLGIAPRTYPLFSIEDVDWIGKPQEKAFQKVLDSLGWDIKRTLFLDDHPANVQTFLNMGGQALLVTPRTPEDSPLETLESIWDLRAFLQTISSR